MKFKAPPLSAENRGTLERIKKWFTDRVGLFAAKKACLDKLTLAFKEAESRKNQFAQDATLNADAAINLSGAETQLSRLVPEIKSSQQSLEMAKKNDFSYCHIWTAPVQAPFGRGVGRAMGVDTRRPFRLTNRKSD